MVYVQASVYEEAARAHLAGASPATKRSWQHYNASSPDLQARYATVVTQLLERTRLVRPTAVNAISNLEQALALVAAADQASLPPEFQFSDENMIKYPAQLDLTEATNLPAISFFR